MSETPKPQPKARPKRRRWWRRLFRFAFIFLLLVFGGPALFMWIATPSPGHVTLPALEEEATYVVYMMEENHHTAILIEQPAGWRLGPPGDEAAPLVEYAWGEKRYYKDSERTLDVKLAALFVPTESVIYLRGRYELPDKPLWRREVTAAELRTLVTALEQGFERTDDGERAQPHPRVEYYVGTFYPARKYFIFWYVCNTWTVARLADADLASSSFGVITSGQAPKRLEGFEVVNE